jgi:hypothetical protein
MNVFLHTMVRGINDRLVDGGEVSWPDAKVASEVCFKVAASLNGPEMLPEGGLDKASALAIIQTLKAASAKLASSGYRANVAEKLRAKQASSLPIEQRAAESAIECMDKAASDASLTSVGENTPESAAAHDQTAALDQANRPQGTYHVGVGKTQMPFGPNTGKEMPHPHAPSNTAQVNNSAVEMTRKSASLASFALGQKSAEDMPMGDMGAGMGQGGGQSGPPQGMPPQGQGGGEEAQLMQLLQSLPPEQLHQILAQLQGGGPEGGQPQGPPQGAPEGGPEDMIGKAASLRDGLARLLGGRKETPATSNGHTPETNAPKVASGGSLTDVEKNTPASAAKTDQSAALDLKNRSEKEHMVEQGKSKMKDEAQVYEVKSPAPAKENPVSTDTTPSRETKSANVTEEEQLYLDQLNKTAELWGAKLPMSLTMTEKVAHIEQLHGLRPSERAAYVAKLVGR